MALPVRGLSSSHASSALPPKTEIERMFEKIKPLIQQNQHLTTLSEFGNIYSLLSVPLTDPVLLIYKARAKQGCVIASMKLNPGNDVRGMLQEMETSLDEAFRILQTYPLSLDTKRLYAELKSYYEFIRQYDPTGIIGKIAFCTEKSNAQTVVDTSSSIPPLPQFPRDYDYTPIIENALVDPKQKNLRLHQMIDTLEHPVNAEQWLNRAVCKISLIDTKPPAFQPLWKTQAHADLNRAFELAAGNARLKDKITQWYRTLNTHLSHPEDSTILEDINRKLNLIHPPIASPSGALVLSPKISMTYSTAIAALVLAYVLGMGTALIGRRIIQR